MVFHFRYANNKTFEFVTIMQINGNLIFTEIFHAPYQL